ncbi:MAG: F0F1 ATP synthase subunit A [Pseudomonadota bacterium]
MSAAKSVEVPNFISLFAESFPDNHTLHTLFRYETVIFSLISIVVASTVVYLGTRRLTLIPGKLQNLVEFLFEALFGLISSILGEKRGRKYFSFLAALFVYVFMNNMIGLIPLFKSSTGVYTTTLPLAVMVFIYVQWTAFTKMGPAKYMFHLAGEPRELIQYILAPFMFCLHLISELARPLTLSLRLFGNVMGEDILLGVFAGFGIGIMAWAGSYIGLAHPPVGIPLQLPFYFLCLIGGMVQALVFTLLSTIYFSLALPHEEDHH